MSIANYYIFVNNEIFLNPICPEISGKKECFKFIFFGQRTLIYKTWFYKMSGNHIVLPGILSVELC